MTLRLILIFTFSGFILMSGHAANIPYDTLQSWIAAHSVTGQGRSFTPEVYERIQMLLKLFMVMGLGAVALVGLKWRMLTETSIAYFKFTKRDLRDLANRLVLKVHTYRKWLGALALLCAATAMIWRPFLADAIKHDEAATLELYASRSFFSIFSMYTLPNNHILHSLFVRIAFLFKGYEVEWLRLPALIGGLCVIPLTFFAAIAMGLSALGAWSCAILVSTSPGLLEFATQARGYTIQTSIVLVCVLLLVRILAALSMGTGSYPNSQIHRPYFTILCFGFCGGLGFLTIPTMALPLSILFIWGVLELQGALFVKVKRRLFPFCVAFAAVALMTLAVYTPALLFVGPKAITSNPFVTPEPVGVFLAALPHFFSQVVRFLTWPTHPVLSAIVVIACLYSVLTTVPGRALLLGIGVTLLMTRKIPFLRVWLPLLPLMTILAVITVEKLALHLWRRNLQRISSQSVLNKICFISISLIGFSIHRVPAWQVDPNHPWLRLETFHTLVGAEEVVDFVQRNLSKEDRVYCLFPNETMLRFYFRKAQLPDEMLNGPPSSKHSKLFAVFNKLENVSPHWISIQQRLARMVPSRSFSLQPSAMDHEYIALAEIR